MHIITPKILPLNYELVPDRFEGELEYIADFDCGNYLPYAVWKNNKPNRDKNHKDFMMLGRLDNQFFVTGRDSEDMKKYLTRDAIHCHSCDEVLFSLYRHDYRSCSCGKVSIDGGSDYCKIASEKNAVYTTGQLDLLTKTFKKGE